MPPPKWRDPSCRNDCRGRFRAGSSGRSSTPFPTATAIDLRDRAILELLYSSGLRVSEVASLAVDDVGGDLLTVTGKGGKDRAVPGRRTGPQSDRRLDRTGSRPAGRS